MISTVKTPEGLVSGYIEWNILDENGKTKKDGKYIHIKNFWIHKSFRRRVIMAILTLKIFKHPYSQKSTHVYWSIVRGERGNKLIDDEHEGEVMRRNVKPRKKEYVVKKIIGGLYAN